MGRAASIAWLGWRFVVVQPLRKLASRASARERVERAYFPEGLLPTRPAHREIALAAAACTGCGLCEPRCPRSAEGGALGLQSLFRLHSKHLGELRGAARLLEACAGCVDCDDACPSGVPIARIVEFLRSIAGGGAGA